MKIIKVQYTVKKDYVNENKKKINAVMDELRSVNHPHVIYYSSLMDDGKSFMHIVIYSDETETELPSGLKSFKIFQDALKPNLEDGPHIERFKVVDSSYTFFKK